ncbi:MAG: iron-sulfur cluster assembly scaffold protein [Bacillota bacterium]
MYTALVIDHFINPRNAGQIPDADGIGTIGDPECGDFVRIYIRVRADRLCGIAFEICGCPASIATTSVLTEMASGKSLNEALAITEDDVLKALKGLPESKVHCSNLGVEALRQAIVEYLQRHKKKKEAK